MLLLKYTAFFLGSLLFQYGCFGLHVVLKLVQEEEERMPNEKAYKKLNNRSDKGLCGQTGETSNLR